MPFCPFLVGSFFFSRLQIDYRKKKETLILSSLLEDIVRGGPGVGSGVGAALYIPDVQEAW